MESRKKIAIVALLASGLAPWGCASDPTTGARFACDPDGPNTCAPGYQCLRSEASQVVKGVCTPESPPADHGEGDAATADEGTMGEDPGPADGVVPDGLDKPDSPGPALDVAESGPDAVASDLAVEAGPDACTTDCVQPTDLPVPPADAVDQDPGALLDGQVCHPRETKCLASNFARCNDGGSDWVVTPCTGGDVCTTEGCLKESSCVPNQASCDAQGRVVVCETDGTGHGTPTACAGGSSCHAGRCVDAICTPGQAECTQTHLLTCEGSPPGWVETPCIGNRVCFKDACVECFTDDQCQAPMACVDGACVVKPLEVVTVDLPDGVIAVAYSGLIEAMGGTPPYTWNVTAGTLPVGIALDAATGALRGKPTAGGTAAFTVTATDDGGMKAARELSIRIRTDTNVAITSRSPLPDGEEGTPFSFQFQAIGGTPPHGWMVVTGALPRGLSLSSDGLLSGTPEAHGDYEFGVRVVDAGDPIGTDTRTFALTLKIAPLEIIGETVVNLFLTKAVILPLLTVVPGVPLPYNKLLQAKGGVKPYLWAEAEMPDLLKTYIPKAGIPKDLALADNGTLSGSVTDTSLVFQLKVPIVNYTLTGFFFMADVTDLQEPPASASAIFLIPTEPVNLGGSGR